MSLRRVHARNGVAYVAGKADAQEFLGTSGALQALDRGRPGLRTPRSQTSRQYCSSTAHSSKSNSKCSGTWPSRLTTCISPQHEEFQLRTLWSLSKAFTSAFKQREPTRRFGPRPSSPGSRRLRENRLVSAWPGRGPPGALREFERAGENTGTFIEARHRRLGRAGRARPARERAFARAGFRLTKETICGLIVHWRTSGPSCISRALTANIGSYPASARSS